MKQQFDDLNLYDYFNIILKRKILIIIIVVAVTILSFASAYSSPKIYETQSVINIPFLTAADQTKIPIITTAEAIVIVQNLDRQGYFGSLANHIVGLKAQKIDDVTVNNFQLVVQVKNNPELAVQVTNRMLSFFNENKPINAKIKLDKADVFSKLKETRKALKEAVKIKNKAIALMEAKNSLTFNPVDLQISLNGLEEKKTNLELQLDGYKKFDYVNKPFASSTPIEPKILQSTVLGFLASLFAGIFLAFFMDWLQRNRRTES